ncbi:MAG: hypothetical protein O7C67_15185 [Gammaproteobacteria bacterium]|nr:hypothetical protein [Gammaproteobacteria bacterium]
MIKTPLGLSLWAFTCVAIGLGLAFLDGISLTAIIKAGILMSVIAALLFGGAWLAQTLKK